MKGSWRKRREAPLDADVLAMAADLPVTYCEGWNDVLNQPFNPMSEEDARRRHETGQLYSVLFGAPDAPEAMVEVRLETGHLAVDYFDDRQRATASYTYREHDGRLFHDGFAERWWSRKGTLRAAAVYHFKPDGHVYVSTFDGRTNMEETYAQWATVEDDYDEIPAFGDYSGVLRIDRDIEPLDAPPGPRS